MAGTGLGLIVSVLRPPSLASSASASGGVSTTPLTRGSPVVSGQGRTGSAAPPSKGGAIGEKTVRGTSRGTGVPGSPSPTRGKTTPTTTVLSAKGRVVSLKTVPSPLSTPTAVAETPGARTTANAGTVGRSTTSSPAVRVPSPALGSPRGYGIQVSTMSRGRSCT